MQMQPPPQHPGFGISPRMRTYTLVILAGVYMFNVIDRQILAILLPAIREEFHVGDTILGLLSGTAFALFYVTLGIPAGQLADRFNRRNLVALALALWSAMTALSGLAANIWHLALARVGIGVGEAGCSPPAHSIISDLYPPEKRSSAMGGYALGVSAGVMFAYLIGGWIAQNLGWRAAFVVVGLPGLLLALIVRFTLPEPARGSSESRIDNGRPPAFLNVLRFLMSRRSFVYMATGAGLNAFVANAVVSFLPSFMIRSFTIEIAELGVWLGLIYGIAGGIGFYGGGYLADYLGHKGHRQVLRIISATAIASALLFATLFVAPTATWALLLMILPTITLNIYYAPVLSQTQNLVSLRMRSVASALVLLILNVIGLAFGPAVTGLVSDLLAPSFGLESMRYSLLIICSITLPLAAWCYWQAGSSIDNDLLGANEYD